MNQCDQLTSAHRYHDGELPQTQRQAFEDPSGPEAHRSIIVVHVTRVADTCGYGVPLMTFEGKRPHAKDWLAKKLDGGGLPAIATYTREKNALSIDGLPAIDPPDDAPDGKT